MATASTARSGPCDQWCLVLGDGSSIAWASPPPAVRKLLEELFSAQPAEALTWVHHAVWSLQAHEIVSKLQNQVQSTAFKPLSPPPSLGLFSGRSSPVLAGVASPTSSTDFHMVASSLSDVPGRKRPTVDRNDRVCAGRSGHRHKTAPALSDRGESLGARSEPLKAPSSIDSADEVVDFNSIVESGRSTPEQRRDSVLADLATTPRGSEHWEMPGGLPSMAHALTESSKSRARSESTPITARVSGLSTFLRVANTHSRQVVPAADEHMPIIRSMSACSNRSHSEEITNLELAAIASAGASPWALKKNEATTELTVPAVQTARRLSAPPPFSHSGSNRFSVESAVSKRSSRPDSLVVDPINGSLLHGKKLSQGSPFAPVHSSSQRSIGPVTTNKERGSMQTTQSDLGASAVSDTPKNLKTLKRGNSFQSSWINKFTGTAHDASAESEAGTDDDVSFISDGHGQLMQSWCSGLREDVDFMTWPRLFWECAWMICILYELWLALFMLVFWTDSSFPEGIEALSAIVLSFFCMDILVNCITAYKEHGYVIYSHRRIIEHYAKSWFFYDFALVVSDFCLLVSGNSSKVLQVFKLIRAIRLWRAWEDAMIFLRIFGDNSFRLIAVNCGLLNVALLLLSHINASIWAAIQDDAWMLSTGSTAFDRYLASLWRAHCALTSGYEVNVNATSHWLFSIIVGMERATLITACIYYMVRTVLLRGGSDVEQDHLEDEVLGFLKRRNVPCIAQMSVLTNVHEVCKARKLQRCFDILQGHSIPVEIRTAVAEIFWASKLRSLGLVKELMDYHSYFARELCLSTFGEFVPSRTILFRSSEPSHAAYYVVGGVLEVRFTEDEDDPIDDYTSGMWAGEKAVVNFELRRGETVACKTLAELMVLSAMEFRRLLNRFDLSEVVEDLIKVNLWMGFCGRCGMFGDHFKRDCPILQQKRENRGIFQRMLYGKTVEAEHLIGKDLRVFLDDYNLERLILPMRNHGVQHLIHLSREKIDELIADPDVNLTPDEEMILNNGISTFRKKHATGAIKVLANSGDAENHLVFISHYKVEAGTEATLMQNDILQLLAEDNGLPGQDLASPVFLDSEDLQDLEELQEHVKRSHNLILLLTNGVLTRPWVLVEVVTAINSGVNVLPVEIQRRDIQFQYPDEGYYQRLMAGEELDKTATDLLIDEGVELEELCKALRQVFKRIAVPFSPHKTATVRKAELQDILKRCQIKKGRTSLKNADTIVQICRPKSDITEAGKHLQSPRATLSAVLPAGTPRGSHRPGSSTPRLSDRPPMRASDRPSPRVSDRPPPRRGSTDSNLSSAPVGKSFFSKLMKKGGSEPNTNNRLMPGPPGHSGTKKNLLDVDSAATPMYGSRSPSPIPSVTAESDTPGDAEDLN